MLKSKFDIEGRIFEVEGEFLTLMEQEIVILMLLSSWRERKIA